MKVYVVKIRKNLNKVVLSAGLLAGAFAATAQTQLPAEPRNVVQLSASGTVEAQQDWLTLTLSASKDGSDANTVQATLRQALETALSEVKKTAQPGGLEVHSGAFNLQPRYSNEGKINGWSGSTELVLEGSDFARISGAAAKAQTMTIRNLGFGLSRQLRAQLETQAQTQAIDNFKLKAAQIAHSFGFSDFHLREVSVSTGDQSMPAPRMMAMSARGMVADAAPVPLEAGKSLVLVTVSGAVQLK
jgi:predicted secreted protein